MTAIERALRHIEALMRRRAPKKEQKSKPKPPASKRYEKLVRAGVPRSAARRVVREEFPTPDPVDQVKLAEQQAVFTPPPEPPFEWSITAERTKAVPAMTDAEALKLGILPNGELLEDVLETTEPARISPALYTPPLEQSFDAMGHAQHESAPLPVTRPHWAAAFESASQSTPPAPAAQPSTTGRVARGSCKAVDAKTGRTCKLPAHAGPKHAHERGAFHLVAAPGQAVGTRRAIDDAAWNSTDGVQL